MAQSADSRTWRTALTAALLVAAVGNAAAAAATSTTSTTAPTADQVARGRYLAGAGGCEACHSAPNGPPYAGGAPIKTPFGTIVAPNITPDKATGIGAWTDAQFYAALHDGIGRRGEYLYPVMPFPYYARVTRDDVQAIRAYLSTVPPVSRPRQANHLTFPFSIRPALLAWREAFFRPADFHDDPSRPAAVNRGDYLVNGLGHCGECHSSRVLAGTSRWQKPLQGGAVDNWYAPNITSDLRDGIGGWTDEQLVQFLKSGVAPGKGVAAGPMAETVHALQRLNDDDLRAMAAYLKSTPAAPTVNRAAAADTGWKSAGGAVYLDRCASCHGVDGGGQPGVVPALAANSAVLAKGDQNVISVVLGGLQARQGYAPMLAIGAAMDDASVADVTNYVRQAFGNHAPANATVDQVSKLRAGVDTPMTGGRVSGCPAVAQPALVGAAGGGGDIAARLAATTQQNMASQVPLIVAAARKAAPAAAKADVVNDLTAAYCAVVRGDAQLDWNARALRIGQFSQLVYLQFGSRLPATAGTRRAQPANARS